MKKTAVYKFKYQVWLLKKTVNGRIFTPFKNVFGIQLKNDNFLPNVFHWL